MGKSLPPTHPPTHTHLPVKQLIQTAFLLLHPPTSPLLYIGTITPPLSSMLDAV